MFNTYEDFKKTYDIDNIEKLSYEEFYQRFTKSDTKAEPVLYIDYIKSRTWNDYRDNHDSWMHMIYEFFYSEPERILRQWWEDHCAISNKSEIMDELFFDNKNIEVNGFIDGKKFSVNGRVIKNLFYDEIYYGTERTNSGSVATLTALLGFVKEYTTNRKATLSPQTFDIIKNKDYSTFFAILRGITSKASVFNPYTYYYIIQNILPKGKSIYCPVSSWCVPVLAFNNLTTYNHMVMGDVLSEVLTKSEKLHEFINNRNTIFAPDKTLETVCLPTESLKNTNFPEKYKESFDTVFFCPPYYNLELYPDPDGNQSTTTYKTYEAWLEGYWKATVDLCYDTLKTGGCFSFVIVEKYRDVQISKDMLEYAMNKFEHVESKKLSWGGFKIRKQNHGKRENVIEDVHILKKI